MRAYLRWTWMLIAALALSLPMHGIAEEEETPLGRQMETLDDAFKDLQSELKKPAPDEKAALAAAQTIRDTAARCLEFEPASIGKAPEGDREKLKAQYQEQMKAFAADTTKLFQAVEKKDWNAVKGIMGGMQKKKRAGHEKFRTEE